MFCNFLLFLVYIISSRFGRAGGRPNFFDTYSTKIIRGKRNTLALHAAKIIRDQLFLVLPSDNACTSNYNIKTNENTYFSGNNKHHRSNNNYKCLKPFAPYGPHTVNQKIQ